MNWILFFWLVVALLVIGAMSVRAIGGDFRLVGDWKLSLKYYSTWGYGLLLLFPEFWNELLAAGLFADGEGFGMWESMGIKLLTLWVAFSQKVKQVDRPPVPNFGHDDTAAPSA